MATHRPGLAAPAAEFAAALLTELEVGPRARLTANQVTDLLAGAAAVVYVVEDPENPNWTPKATAGEITAARASEFRMGTLGRVVDRTSPLVIEGRGLRREDYAHLDVRRSVSSLCYLPLITDDTLCGVVEVVLYEQALLEDAPQSLRETAEIAAPAIAGALAYERERNSTLHSISRVTQMYDLEKVFNSNLEIDPLIATIASKFQEVMRTQAVNVWMVDGDAVRLVSRAGEDATVALESTHTPGDGIAGEVSDNGETILVTDPEDPRLRARNAGVDQGTVFSVVAAPLMDREALVGVVEAVNRVDGLPFDDDDLFLLTNICETASNALHNASLLQSERKVQILESLVKVSREITSTLDIDRVLQAVVNNTQSVLAYDRAAIALEQRGSLQLKAVSGNVHINFSDPTIKLLKEMLEWASISSEELHVVQRGDAMDISREANRPKFSEYFEATGARAFYALPLDDDQGRLGIMSFESRDPEFLTQAHKEVIRVLAAQATVALRNASLYREVPFIELLEPVLEKKRKFMALEKRRRAMIVAVAALAVLFLIFFPVPMRLAGDATVAPLHKAQVMPGVDGVVKSIYVREGDAVRAGAIVADLEDWDYRASVSAAQARYETALSEMSRALSSNDGTEAGIERVQADYWAAELGRARERLEKTHLRSPLDGVVATAHVENFLGKHLSPADSFVEVIDSAQASVDVAIDEQDAALLRAGESATIKLDSYPTRSFQGDVRVVSPVGAMDKEAKVFFARVVVPNPERLLRSGMQGRGKVRAGWRPAGYVMFRRPALWIYSKLWSGFGW